MTHHPSDCLCDAETCDTQRRKNIQSKCRELQARLKAKEEAQWSAFREKSLARPPGVVVDMATRRNRKVFASTPDNDNA